MAARRGIDAIEFESGARLLAHVAGPVVRRLELISLRAARLDSRFHSVAIIKFAGISSTARRILANVWAGGSLREIARTK
jgi:hypothetical protein